MYYKQDVCDIINSSLKGLNGVGYGKYIGSR